MSETGGTGIITPTMFCEVDPCSIGIAAPGFQIKVVDSETGKSLPAFKRGEICLRNPHEIMKGYFQQEDETRKIINQDGWLHTGDVGFYEPKHHLLYVTGRIKDIIKVNGMQVSPEELEDVIQQMQGVDTVAVVGVPHALLGEAPRAFVKCYPNETVSEDDINAHVNQRVAKYKQLKGGISFVDEIPISPTGKILRRMLKP